MHLANNAIDQGRRQFSAMAKPVGALCNLNCSYCYYLSKGNLHGMQGCGAIPDAILEKHIHDTLEGNESSEVIFDWQGGEPTLLGIDFFKKVLRFQEQICPPNKVVLNNLQTNGTLLNEDWCRFLRDNRFLVGLSLDGPKSLHDAYRRDKGGDDGFSQVVEENGC